MSLTILCKHCAKRIVRCLDEGIPWVHFEKLERACQTLTPWFASTWAEPKDD